MFIPKIKISFYSLFITALIFSININAQKTSLKPYNIKSGIIEYKYSGTFTGKSVMYFDDYGLKSAVKNDKSSQYTTDNKWIISLKEEQYIFDPSKPNEGIKMKNPLLQGFFEMQQEDFNKFYEEFYSRMGFKKSGTEKYLGKDCIVYKGDLGKILVWNGILLYSETKFADTVSKQEATSLKVNIPIDQKYFEIPKNIKFTETPDFEDIDKYIQNNDDSEK